jgi:hypothetical protein
MNAVVAFSGGFVGAGYRDDPLRAKAAAAAWRSAALPWQASFSGGEVDGLAVAGTTVVAVGRGGYPDTDTAAVWVRGWP